MNNEKNFQINILFDYRIFSQQKYGGISRYFTELFERFDKAKDISYTLAASNSSNEYLKASKLAFYNFFIKKFSFIGKYRITERLNRNKLTIALKKNDFDVFHPTYYDPYFLKYLREKPFVLTVYDLIHEKYSALFPKEDKTIENKKLLISKASKIIAISEHTKKDIMEVYKISPDKIKVIYMGNSFDYQAAEGIKFQLPKRYILFVGDRHTYKNFTFFVRSLKKLLQEDNDLFLVCAGSRNFTEEEINIFKDYKIENKITHKEITNDNTLASIYKNAQVFVFPSLYEGFGIPVLEAFSCGCPVALSNTSSLPEVGGDAALYFDPEDSDSIEKIVKQIIYNADIKNKLRGKGYIQVKKFSWDKTAEETVSIYKEVVKEYK